MGCDYSIRIEAFKPTNISACLAELHKVAPEIGNGMWVKADHLVFDHRLSLGRWRDAEQEAAVVISRHIAPGCTCIVEYDSEGIDGRGGWLISQGRLLDLSYQLMVTMEGGRMVSLEEAQSLLQNAPEGKDKEEAT
jgi:hypothetical protein